MGQFISIIMNASKYLSVRTILGKLFAKYGNKAVLDLIARGKGVIDKGKMVSSYLDPKQIGKLLLSLTAKEKQELFREIEKMDSAAYRELKAKTVDIETKGTKLSSSGIQKGMYQSVNKSTLTGNLTILIKQDGKSVGYGPYTYPEVPWQVWEKMKEAKGKNGSGAGKVFWDYWLRSGLPSELRKHTIDSLSKDAGIEPPDRIHGKKAIRATRYDNPELKRYQVTIKSLGQSGYRSDVSRTASYISGREGREALKQERANIYKGFANQSSYKKIVSYTEPKKPNLYKEFKKIETQAKMKPSTRIKTAIKKAAK